jgi:hypothetical protein
MLKNTSSQKGTVSTLILLGPVLYFIAASHAPPSNVVTDNVSLKTVATSLPMITKINSAGDTHSDDANTAKK